MAQKGRRLAVICMVAGERRASDFERSEHERTRLKAERPL